MADEEDANEDHQGPGVRGVPLTLPRPRVGEPDTL
jgi:hypothetical protein